MSFSNGEVPSNSRTVFPLSSLSIGFWSSRKSRKVLLLSLPDKEKFVLLSVEDSRQKASGRLDKALSQVNSIWDSRNPFNACSPSSQNDTTADSNRWVVAFEVEWSHIVGIDYRFCLLQEGRLVLETSCVVKRVFKTIEDVHAFYEWTPPDQGDAFNDFPSDGATSPSRRRNTYSGGYDRFFSPTPPGSSLQYGEWHGWRRTEEMGGYPCGYFDTRFDVPRSSSYNHEMLRCGIGQVTPRGSSRYSLANLPCTPPRVSSTLHSWPSSQLCDALHLMGASHKDASLLYRTPSIPGPARFTLPSAMYSCQTVILGFCDPHLLSHLAAWVKADVSRVKLYESGLPSWAVFLPSYGLWYYPWMRTAAWVLYMAISIFSMACGFYDLYKNVPYLKQVVSSIMARLHLPRYALLEWLERHAQIRLSILLTYMFSKSPLFASFLRLLTSFLTVATNILQPMLSPLSPIWDSIFLATRTFINGCSMLAATTQEVVIILFGPPVRTSIAFLYNTGKAATEVLCVVGSWTGSALLAPLQLLMLPLWTLLAMLLALWQGLQASAEQAVVAWRAFRSTWGTVKAGSKVVKGGLKAAAPVAQSVPVLSLLQVPGEALDMLRMSFIKVVKALQAVIRFLISLVLKVVQHRFSLTLQAYRYWSMTQASILAKLRRRPWINRLLPAPPDPDPHPEYSHPLASTSFNHATFAHIHPHPGSLSRSSSSSSIHDSEDFEVVQEHAGLGRVPGRLRSHALSLRMRGGSVADGSADVCGSHDDGMFLRGRLVSWTEGEVGTVHSDELASSSSMRLAMGVREREATGTRVGSVLQSETRENWAGTASSGLGHGVRHRRVRSEHIRGTWFEPGTVGPVYGCMSADAGWLESAGPVARSALTAQLVGHAVRLSQQEAGQKPHGGSSKERAGVAEYSGLGERAAGVMGSAGDGAGRAGQQCRGVREKAVRTSMTQTSPAVPVDTAPPVPCTTTQWDRPTARLDIQTAQLDKQTAQMDSQTAQLGSCDGPNTHKAAKSAAEVPVSQVPGVDIARAGREASVEESTTWGVRHLPWASYPSLHLHTQGQTMQGSVGQGHRMQGVETAPPFMAGDKRPASMAGEKCRSVKDRASPRQPFSSGKQVSRGEQLSPGHERVSLSCRQVCSSVDGYMRHAGLSVVCACGAQMVLTDRADPAGCRCDACVQSSSSSYGPKQSRAGLYESQASLETCSPAPDLRERERVMLEYSAPELNQSRLTCMNEAQACKETSSSAPDLNRSRLTRMNEARACQETSSSAPDLNQSRSTSLNESQAGLHSPASTHRPEQSSCNSMHGFQACLESPSSSSHGITQHRSSSVHVLQAGSVAVPGVQEVRPRRKKKGRRQADTERDITLTPISSPLGPWTRFWKPGRSIEHTSTV